VRDISGLVESGMQGMAARPSLSPAKNGSLKLA